MLTVTAGVWPRIRRPGLASALASAAALGWRGQRELDRPLAPINAPSQWLWGERALREGGASLRHTGVGAVTHVASSLLWAGLFDAIRQARRRRTPANAVADAVITTGVAAVVDLVVVPRRLTPGFERQLSHAGVAWFYAAFAAGLALGALSGPDGRRA